MAFDFNQDQNNNSLMSDINVTPFVDVMLVLLIIFMVTAPMMVQGIDVKLPEVDLQSIGTEEERVIISMPTGGQIYLDEYKVDLKTLGPKIKRLMEVRKTREVFLRADKSIPYGRVAEVMAEVRKAGVSSLGLVTEAESVRKPKKEK